MRANFDESRPLFLRIFLKKLRTFQSNIVPPDRIFKRKLSWSIDNSQYRAKVQRNELSSQGNVEELTHKGKGRSSNFRGSKTNTTTAVFRGREKHFSLQCSLVFLLVRPGWKPSCKTEENVFTTKDMQVSTIFM